jgi:uncharacterized protein YceH (UPF0502 family)
MLAASQSELLAVEEQLVKLESTLETERQLSHKCLGDLQLQIMQTAEISALLTAEKKLSGELKTRVHVVFTNK